MNKEIALILRDRLLGLSYLEVVAGLVQTVTTSDTTESGTVIKKFPVSSDTNIPQTCSTTPEKALTPDSSKKSIIYFEDFGTGPGKARGRFQGWVSSLRLVCWYNKRLLYDNPASQANAVMMAEIIDKLETKSPENNGPFMRIISRVARLPIMDANIFSRYTYDERDRQYLRPPYDFFAIDINVAFEFNTACRTGLILKSPAEKCYNNPPTHS